MMTTTMALLQHQQWQEGLQASFAANLSSAQAPLWLASLGGIVALARGGPSKAADGTLGLGL
jgi:hypothetical protein